MEDSCVMDKADLGKLDEDSSGEEEEDLGKGELFRKVSALEIFVLVTNSQAFTMLQYFVYVRHAQQYAGTAVSDSALMRIEVNLGEGSISTAGLSVDRTMRVILVCSRCSRLMRLGTISL